MLHNTSGKAAGRTGGLPVICGSVSMDLRCGVDRIHDHTLLQELGLYADTVGVAEELEHMVDAVLAKRARDPTRYLMR
jgi:hypothetical protein